MDNAPSLDIVLAAVHAVVRPVVKTNELHTLTHKSIRTKVEEKLGLSHGTLEEPEYKRHVKRATLEAMDTPPSEGEEKPEKLSKKRKPAAKAVKKRKSAVVSDASGGEDEEVEEKQKQKKSRVSEPPKPKKRKAKSPPPDSEEYDEAPKASSSRAKPQASTPSKPKKKKKPVHVSPGEADDAMSEPEEVGDFEGDDEEVKHKKRAVSMKGQGKEAASIRKPTTSKSSAKPSSRSSAPKKLQGKASLQFKTPEHVPTSDMEQDDMHEAKELSPKKSPKKQAKAPVPRKHRKGSTMALSDSGDEDEGGRRSTPSPSPTPKKFSSTPKKVKQDSPVKNETKRVVGDGSESEMSSLIDEEPPKKSKSTSRPKKQSKPDAKKRKATTSAKDSSLTKEEETIKKLKSYIVGCGVRKKWATLFAGLSERQQISELKTILSGLGMTPPLSMEKAHKIKAKREFEQELEDVKEFAQSMSKRDGKKGTLKETSEEEEQSEEEAPVVRRKRLNARNSIAAFLGDQSDSD